MRDLDILLYQDASGLYIPEYVDPNICIFKAYTEAEDYADLDTIASRFIVSLHNKHMGGLRVNIFIPFTELSCSVDMIISVLKAAYCIPYLEINILRYDVNKSIWRIHNFQFILEMWARGHCEPRTYNEAYYS